MSSDDYEVGYKKPPKHGQFKPGQSGNRSGRGRKNKPSIGELFLAEGNRVRPVLVNGKLVSIRQRLPSGYIVE